MSAYPYSPLLTDLYQLTMAYGYWQLQMHEQEAVFYLSFRHHPFNSNHALLCGIGSLVEYLKQWHFQADDLTYLSSLKDPKGAPLFPSEFLEYLARLSFSCDIDAISEGTVVFANEPLLRIQGPLLQCQLLESPILNIINFQTLVATKASRICRAAAGDPVIEFGLRRAQGPDGAVSASRAAYIGGCVATSNTLAGKLFDIPVRGTHAHSWVSAFANETESFTHYLTIMPNNSVLLVDTYDTINGVKQAIEASHTTGKNLLGIRLDSGDMASLSIAARQLLDEAGMQDTDILASNSLDEKIIQTLKQQGATINAWGVGTQLATAYDQPALDGVYKLSALQNKQGKWEYKLKLSEQAIKISNPGNPQVRRFSSRGHYCVDIIYDRQLSITDTPEYKLLNQNHSISPLDSIDHYVDLLQPICLRGSFIDSPSIHSIRETAIAATSEFCQAHKDDIYPVGIELNLDAVKQALVKQYRKSSQPREGL